MNLFLQTQYYLSRGSKVTLALLIATFLTGTAGAEVHKAGLASSVKKNLENVTGTVKDAKGEPLPGVSILIKGTKTSTITDAEGRFRINLPTGNETLVFSYLGFESQEVAMAGRTTLEIALKESENLLNQVVVTGYGEKKRSEIVGSVATVTGEELQDIPSANIAGALRNRIAGVGVSQISGRPGSSISLNIRNSTTSEQGARFGATDEPLYIIDGITVTGDDFDNLDPSMVENITILKDASAAIYGASGAKGVVLITTKKGKEGKPTINYNGYLGVSDAAKKVDMLTGYEQALLLNDGNLIGNAPSNTFFSASDLEYIKNLNYPSWYDELWKSSLTQRHNLSISGGTDKLTFFSGGSFQNENGNYAGMKADKYSFRTGLRAKITPAFSAEVNFSVDHNVRSSNNGLSERDNTFFETIITTPRWVPTRIDGKLVSVDGERTHPFGVIESGYYSKSKSQNYRINANISYAPQNFLKGLTARLQVSQGGGNTNGTEYQPNYNVYTFERFGNNNQLYSNVVLDTLDARAGNASSLSPTLSRDNSYQGFLTLQYAKTIAKHSFSAMAGGEQTESNNENLGVRWTTQQISNIDEYWAFDPISIALSGSGRSIGEGVKRSFFGRATYDFDKKYLFDATARYDASSNFAKGNIWGLSHSIGFAWLVSEENFFKNNVNFINYLKFKVNSGVTGDDRVNARLWQERYTVDVANGYLYGSSNNTVGLNPQTYPNPSITWEKKRTFNTGVEMSLFNSKLDLGIEVFRNKTYDGFDGGLNEVVPMFAGFSAPTVNYRTAYNWGSEFTIGYRAKIGRELRLNTSVNFGFGNSVVEQMLYNPYQLWENTPEDWKIGFGTDPRVYNSGNIGLKTVGMFKTQAEVDAFLAQNPRYTIDGKIPQVGWLYFEDTNNDGVITDKDMGPMFDRVDPLINSGINLGLSYKSFSLSTNILARIGGKRFYDSNAMERPEPGINVPGFWRDRWTPDNPNGKFPRFDDASTVRQWKSDFWAVDGTTIRVNNMTLTYKVPESLTSKWGMSNARILATGNNLWTIVNPLDYKDPYSNYVYDYPILRTISLGLSVGL